MKSGLGRFIVLFFATGAGVGYFPFASGTVSTLIAGIPLYLLFISLFSPVWYLAAVGAFILFSLYFCDAGERALGKKDPGVIVLDEICGFLVAMALIPFTLPNLAAVFLLFRLFDIIKPFPAHWSQDNLPGGAGVLFDDVFAGIYANLLVRLGIFVFDLC